ncbi:MULTISPECIES: hypothetical protein [Sinorhizobium]|nr:hypothetical protein [Sinorhizobium medicae]RVP50005.1 hypothetical protein CN078_21435 [Sinorhizobium medicae]UWU09393.1 hypothetical protein N2598_06525 [Sinorhizobium medicae]
MSMFIWAENTFTEALLVQGGQSFDVSIGGTFEATVVVQRCKPGTSWFDVGTFTAPAEKVGVGGTAWYYRIGVKTGQYVSGTIEVGLYAS